MVRAQPGGAVAIEINETNGDAGLAAIHGLGVDGDRTFAGQIDLQRPGRVCRLLGTEIDEASTKVQVIDQDRRPGVAEAVTVEGTSHSGVPARRLPDFLRHSGSMS